MGLVDGARLIVVAGLPGSGKSTLADAVARRTGVAVLSVDPAEDGMHDAGLPPSHERGVAAYLVVARLSEHLLRLGQPVIVDACNAESEGRAVWVDLGRRTGAPATWLHVTCSDPAVHRARLEGRGRRYPGVAEPAWTEVEARASGFDGWSDERITVDTIAPVDDLVDEVVRALRLDPRG